MCCRHKQEVRIHPQTSLWKSLEVSVRVQLEYLRREFSGRESSPSSLPHCKPSQRMHNAQPHMQSQLAYLFKRG